MEADTDAISLANAVYAELKRRLDSGDVKPGQFIDLHKLGLELEISRTPLRDALIRLELEGFVTIFPRRGVMVNGLGLSDIRDLYEVIGALEALTAEQAAARLRPDDVARMEELCSGMEESIARDDFSAYYEQNLAFHDAYLSLSSNRDLLRSVMLRKERLYDFPRRGVYVKDWELSSNLEHRRILELFKAGDCRGAAAYIRDVHWSYDVQERFIKQYYIEASRITR